MKVITNNTHNFCIELLAKAARYNIEIKDRHEFELDEQVYEFESLLKQARELGIRASEDYNDIEYLKKEIELAEEQAEEDYRVYMKGMVFDYYKDCFSRVC